MNNKRKLFYALMSITCVIFLIATFCHNVYNKIDSEETFKYEIAGYSYDPPAYKKSAHRYLFCKGELGSFTFEVSPQTYYDAEHGQKTMYFTHSIHELKCNATNKQTKENIKKYFVDNKKILSELEYDWYFIFEFVMLLSYFALVLIMLYNPFAMSLYNNDNDTKFYLTWYDKAFMIINYLFMIIYYFNRIL